MSKPVNQHDIPATYLRNFTVKDNPSLLWCYYNEYNKERYKCLSADSNFFKTKDFYTDSEQPEPYKIEKHLSTKIEPVYNKIIKSIKSCEVSTELVDKLLEWVYYSMTRTKAMRFAFGRYYINRIIPSIPKWVNKDYKFINNLASDFSKKTQLDILFNKDVKNAFFANKNSQQFVILKSNVSNKFISNSNPGFSIKINNNLVDVDSINFLFKPEDSVYFYPLTPDYCLMVLPRTIERYSILDYKISSDQNIDFINSVSYAMVIDTSLQYLKKPFLIANNKEQLTKVVKNGNQISSLVYL